MGAKQSKPKNENDNELKLPNVLDHIASTYITTAKFKDLENLHDPEYCNKLVILTSKIIDQNLHLLDLDYMEQRTQMGKEINKMTKDKILYLGKEQLNDIDVKNVVKKQRMCTGIARFYVRIAHIYAAISKTVNPSYSIIDEMGNHKNITQEEKSKLPKHIYTNMSKYNLCSRRITALKLRQNTDNGMIIKVKNCDMNKKNFKGGAQHMPFDKKDTESSNENTDDNNTIVPVNDSTHNMDTSENNIPQTNLDVSNTDNDTEVEQKTQPTDISSSEILNDTDYNETKDLSDEPGISELEMLYYDVYDFNEKKYNSMSKESQKQYNKDLKIFYETFTGKKLQNNSNIQKFSDIPLIDFHNQDLCKDKDSPWLQSYSGNKNMNLFKEYAKHVANMIKKTQVNEQKLLEIIEDIFVYWIDVDNKEKKLTINPKLTHEVLDKITKKTRDVILKLYIDCEKDFQKGLNIFEAIVKKNMLHTKERQANNLNKLLKSLENNK